MQRARNGLAMALGLAGREAVVSAGFSARREVAFDLVERNVWGVRFPDIRFESAVRPADGRGISLLGSAPAVDESARRFEEVLDLTFEVVSVEMKLKRIGQEIRKLTRRINALRDRVVPGLRSAARRIVSALEEREREDLFRVKRFKAAREFGAVKSERLP